jgi:predicted kinase
MRQLVVLVGIPGSGKTAYHEKQSEWVVVSRDVIRRSIFRHSFQAEFEDAVDRIFQSAVIEAMESSAETVCIDDLNLLRKERRSYVELAQMTQREPIAVIMPYDPADEIYRLARLQLEELQRTSPQTCVAGFPRDRFDAMLRCYEVVRPDEGFTQIDREESLPRVSGSMKSRALSRRGRKVREESETAIPLFAA